MNALRSELPPLEVIDSIETLENLETEVPDHVPQDTVVRQKASNLEHVENWADSDERWETALELYRLDNGERSEIRENVRENPLEPQTEQFRDIDAGNYEQVVFDIIPYNLGRTEPSNFIGTATVADRLGQSFSGEYSLVSILDGQETDETYSEAVNSLQEIASQNLEADIQPADEREIKTNPSQQEIELAEQVLEDTSIPVYEGDRLSCRAAEIVRSQRLAEENDAVVTFYPPNYHDIYGPESEWRQEEIEEELYNQTNAEFYSVAHPFDRDHHNRESSAWNAAYRILDYEGELDVESGVASENSGALSDYRFEPETDDLPNRRQDFLNLLNNLVRSAEVNYGE